ncbi:MAG: outer membrane lipoprotein-sorting protein [Nitrosomonas sp.]|uniref:outer membrane lipoprotein-sorting protein n=1 Tax=Nitrosomonas sp. TaxID=42353 RepID=UPI0025D80CA8|nr:outer membrane lipoprotein-sorting protein [Nitrosomonas sp.]MBY0475342.1 outer membrane lipoprotein-sorting protein [Nitrosomonas sp.]
MLRLKRLKQFNPFNHVILAGVLMLTSFAHLPVAAEDLDQKGFDVAARNDRSDRGFGDSRVELEMVLKNAAGAESRRTLEISTLELPDESVGDKNLIVFFTPADIEGTALLSYAKILDPDDQWLYLPALKRVKRISSKNKSGPFVGSEYAFEDITGQELEKYEYTWLREEPCGELNCDVVERRPRYKDSGYTKQIGWVDQTVYQARKIEYYDRKGSLLKTQLFEDYKLYDDKFWRAHVWRMENHQTGKSTNLFYKDYKFNLGLKDGDFVTGALSRQR